MNNNIEKFIQVLILAIAIILIFGLVSKGQAAEIKVSYNLDKIIEKIASPFDLTQSVKAIALLESNNGDYLINLQDPSCGVTHININTFIARHKIKDTAFNRNKACQDLINSPELSIANTIEELLYWQEQHCFKGRKCTSNQWLMVWASYNGGWNYSSLQAQNYAKKVQKIIKGL